ncbi:MAG: 3-deoxy-D-manno-octulosonic acid transferase [Planctomycetota bacterium]|nr:MAG: 3-deoxy-D-manno-octulosonic acid transferase [Planctomycetota bacterium]
MNEGGCPAVVRSQDAEAVPPPGAPAATGGGARGQLRPRPGGRRAPSRRRLPPPPPALLLDLLYLSGAALLSPLLGWLLLTRPRLRDGLWERLGMRRPVVRAPSRPCILVHGVSVGEVMAVRPLVAELERRLPGYQIAISSTTRTGLEVARRQFAGRPVVRFPLDVSWAVRGMLDAVRPELVLLVELEVWPNFLAHAARRGLKVVLVNGRITERSVRGYLRLGPLMASALGAIEFFCVQSAEYAERFRRLGVPAERLVETGSLKYDALLRPEEAAASAARFRALLGIAEQAPVLVCGSTHGPEEALLLGVYARLRERVPGLRLVLAPRHLQRLAEVEGACRQAGLPYVRWTELGERPPAVPAARPAEGGEAQPVVLLDTVGELARLYAIATVAFVGGSLVPHGGQNMLEPAGLGKAVVFGPHVHNFSDSAQLLLERQAAVQVGDVAALEQALGRLFAEAGWARQLGERARAAVESCRGAARRTAEVVERLLRVGARG